MMMYLHDVKLCMHTEILCEMCCCSFVLKGIGSLFLFFPFSLSLSSPHTAKLAVTTSARHTTGSGPVIVETVSGGPGKSSVTFTFTGTEHGQPPEVTGISPREGPLLSPPSCHWDQSTSPRE